MSAEEIKELIFELQYTLKIASDRAIQHGDKLIKEGFSDTNRGQFLALIENTNSKAENALKQLRHEN